MHYFLHMQWLPGRQRQRSLNTCRFTGELWSLWPPMIKKIKSSCIHSSFHSYLPWGSMNNVGQWLNVSPHTHTYVHAHNTQLSIFNTVSILICSCAWAALQITRNSITHYIRQQKSHLTSTNNSSDSEMSALSTWESWTPRLLMTTSVPLSIYLVFV